MLTTLDLSRGVDERSFVVVATQGHYDEAALEQALATPASYIGLVASRKRAESVLGYLRDRGASDEASRACTRPPGLDLGHLPSEEIAAAILAEIVQLRGRGASCVSPPPECRPPRTRPSIPSAG